MPAMNTEQGQISEPTSQHSNPEENNFTAELSADRNGLQVLLNSDLCSNSIILSADCSSARKGAGKYPKNSLKFFGVRYLG
jgi:hypothetical protein